MQTQLLHGRCVERSLQPTNGCRMACCTHHEPQPFHLRPSRSSCAQCPLDVLNSSQIAAAGHVSGRWQHRHARNVVMFGKRRKAPDPGSEPPFPTNAAFNDPSAKDEDWDAALTTGFPQDKFGMEDGMLPEGEEGEDDDVLGGVDFFKQTFQAPLLGKSYDEDEDEEVEIDEGEFEDWEEEELAEEDEAVDAEAADEAVEPASTAIIEGGIEVETLNYDAIERSTFVTPMGRETDWVESVTRKPEIEIIDQEELDRLEQEKAASTEVAIPEGAQVALNRQGYEAFEMDKVEYLVAETPDGKLDLSDSYVFDQGQSIYARPITEGNIPTQPMLFQCLPWIEQRSPDTLKRKLGLKLMKKVYFVALDSLEPYRLNLERVWMFDSKSRKLLEQQVKTVGTILTEPVLRIRADGIVIEDLAFVPSPCEVSLASELQAGLSKEEMAAAEEKRRAALAERMEEMEAEAERLDELDEAPDVGGASDLM